MKNCELKWEENLCPARICGGYIAVQDLTKASDIIRSRTFDSFFPLVMEAILYFLISWILMRSLEYLGRRTDPKLQRRKGILDICLQ